MTKLIIKKLQKIITDASAIEDSDHFESWRIRVLHFLQDSLSQKAAENFFNAATSSELSYYRIMSNAIEHLEDLLAELEIELTKSNKFSSIKHVTDNSIEKVEAFQSNEQTKIFIVHGHDNEAKESVARFIEKIRLTPIILHEQPNSGRTIIEKFEVYSDVSYAIVILTPDDVGGTSKNEGNYKLRARQNVILELGYFMGKLGRNRVCALRKGVIEIPSDYHGILYIDIDSKGAWKTKIAQEFVQAGININFEGLLS